MKRLALLLILGATLISACAGPKWTRTTVAKQNYFIVTLEQQEGKIAAGQSPYKHPYVIELAELENLMGKLTYTDKGGVASTPKQSPVFQAVEIDRLAPALAEALAKADASQRVRFASFNQGKGMIFSDSRKTEGAVFVDSEGRLNFAFNLINADRRPSETTAIFYTFSSANPLKIETSKTILSAAPPYAELHLYENGKMAPMWVAIDLQKAKESAGTLTAPMVKEPEEAPPAAAGARTMAPPPEKAAPARSSEEMLKEDIKNNLRYIKELRGEGLISEKDYADKKKELLDKIK